MRKVLNIGVFLIVEDQDIGGTCMQRPTFTKRSLQNFANLDENAMLAITIKLSSRDGESRCACQETAHTLEARRAEPDPPHRMY